MGNISKNFNRYEFSCSCGCGLNCVDAELVNVLEDVRTKFNDKPVVITGGNRCKEHNEKVQKEVNPNYVPYSSKSQHINGIACDFKIIGVDPKEVYDYLDAIYPDRYGIGLYSNRCHLDVREIKARW